jgi:hypothetical protein
MDSWRRITQKFVSVSVLAATCNNDRTFLKIHARGCTTAPLPWWMVNSALKEFLADGYNNVTVGWIGMGARVKALVMGRSRGQTPWAPILVYGYNSD